MLKEVNRKNLQEIPNLGSSYKKNIERFAKLVSLGQGQGHLFAFLYSQQ